MRDDRDTGGDAEKWPVRPLRAFLAAAAHASLTRAAAEMGVSQPAISQAVAGLERQFGATLLRRTADSPFLTDQGLILQRRSEAFLHHLAAGVRAQAPLAEVDAIGGAQIRSLLAVAEHGSLAQAARALDVSSASLQRAARELERLLGLTLFTRTAAGLAPTQDGLRLAQALRAAVAEMQAARREIAAAARPTQVRISIGTLPLSSAALVAGACSDMLREFPDALIQVQEGRFFGLLRELRAGRIDLIFGVLRQPDGDDVEQTPMIDRHYHLAARRDHPLVRQERVTYADLEHYDWVLPGAGNPRRKVCEDLLAAVGARPRIRIETNSLSTQRELLVGTDHLTLLTGRELEASGGALAIVPWDDLPTRPAEGLTLRRGWSPSAAQARFIALLRQRAGAGRAVS